jgi:signal transduction histidine kinase
LESRVEQRTAELQSANTQLQDEIRERRQAEESLRDLSGHLLRLRDEERRRLARELHDSTAQILGALVIGLERVVQVVSANDALKAQELLTQSCELAEKATAEVRTLSYLLHPPMLDDLGLEGVLPWYADGFSKRSGIRVSVNVQPGLGRFTRETELTLFRVVQEALTNIHRHSGSPTGEIAVSKDAHGVKLCVTDRGRGIPPGILQSARLGRAMMGVGIAGMGERVRHLNGRLEIESRGYGTSIKVMLPIDAVASPVQANGPDLNVLRTS